MIIVTGAAGFIGSHVAKHFDNGNRLLLVDDPKHFRDRKLLALDEIGLFDWAHGQEDRETRHKILDRAYFPKILKAIRAVAPASDPKAKEHVLLPAGEKIELVIHLGACTNTAEFRKDFLQEWNVDYSKAIWNWCAENKVPLIYASSGATYGNGDEGFSDSHEAALTLHPMNPYGQSKQDFDLWVLNEIKQGKATPPHWYGLKFFNVYGPHESHKGSMASAVLHSFRHIQRTGSCKLFRSANPKVKDGEQSRDFIHVSDIVSIIDFMAKKLPASGLYNNGTGKARTFYSMMEALFHSLDKPLQVEWMETPEQYRKAYQYFTEAEMGKLASVGYNKPFLSLEQGVAEYVAWLLKNEPAVKEVPKNYN